MLSTVSLMKEARKSHIIVIINRFLKGEQTMQNMLDYLNCNPLMDSKKANKLLSDKIKHLLRSQQWDLNSLLAFLESGAPGDHTLALAFSLTYHGSQMLAVLLIQPGPAGVYDQHKSLVFLFSDHYVHASKPVDIETIWRMDIIWDGSVYRHLDRYAKDHPKAGLQPYLTRYLDADNFYKDCSPLQRNILIPLLAQHHKGLELLTKAGLYRLAKHMLLCEQCQTVSGTDSLFHINPDTYNNLQDWLGVSHKVLTGLDRMLAGCQSGSNFSRGWWHILIWNPGNHRPLTNMEFFARLSDIQHYNPAYLNLEKYTPQILRFLMDNHLIHHAPANNSYTIRRRIPGLCSMQDAQILRILRYLTTLSCKQADLYTDYLYYCGRCRLEVKEYPRGLQPSDLTAAYIEAADLYQLLCDHVPYTRSFISQVNQPDYRFLETGKDDLAIGSDYCVRVPQSPGALVFESNHLGHCVKDYCEEVANGVTYILFLRRASCPDKPFVTMEVTKSNILIQVKARENYHAPKDAQLYVRRWAARKGLAISTYDLAETA